MPVPPPGAGGTSSHAHDVARPHASKGPRTGSEHWGASPSEALGMRVLIEGRVWWLSHRKVVASPYRICPVSRQMAAWHTCIVKQGTATRRVLPIRNARRCWSHTSCFSVILRHAGPDGLYLLLASKVAIAPRLGRGHDRPSAHLHPHWQLYSVGLRI